MKSIKAVGSFFALSVILTGCGNGGGPSRPQAELRVERGDVTWVAYQDGDGPWQLLAQNRTSASREAAPQLDDMRRSPRGGSRVSQKKLLERLFEERRSGLLPQASESSVPISDPDGRYGLAEVCVDPVGGYVDVYIRLSTVWEDPRVFAGCYSDDPAERHTLSGSVSGLAEDEFGVVYARFDEVFVDASNNTYGFEFEQDFYDLIATKYGATSTVPSKIIFKADLPLSRNQTLDLDFDGADAFVPKTRSVTIDGVADNMLPYGSVTVRTENYTYAELGHTEDGRTFDYAAIPEPQLGNALYRVRANASGDAGGSNVGIERTFAAPTDISITLPKPLGEADVSVESRAPYVRLGMTWDAYPGGAIEYNNFYAQHLQDVGIYYSVYPSEGWLGSAAQLDYTLPDFSGVAGWNNDWGFKEETEIFWTLSAAAERGEFSAEGYEAIYADRFGVVTP